MLSRPCIAPRLSRAGFRRLAWPVVAGALFCAALHADVRLEAAPAGVRAAPPPAFSPEAGAPAARLTFKSNGRILLADGTVLGQVRLVSKAASGALIPWQCTAATTDKNCLVLKYRPKRSHLREAAEAPAVFTFVPGAIPFTSYNLPSTSPHVRTESASLPVGAYAPHLVLFDAAHRNRLHVSVANWLDFVGETHVSLPGANSPKPSALITWERTGLRPSARLKPDGQWLPLQPPAQPDIEIRVALFRDGPTDPSPGWDMAGTRFRRSDFLALGEPVPPEPTAKAGHIMICDASPALLEQIDDLQAAGVGIVVLRSPDFADISNGVSWQGEYSAAPPFLPELIDALHARGIKVLWWFSILGVLGTDTARNEGRPHPLLLEHPDWFTAETYWENQYRRSQVAAPAWRGWVLRKIRQDLTRFQLDGVALDEPYVFASDATPEGPTAARTRYEFLQAIRNTVNEVRPGGLVVANYLMPAVDEWRFFDHMTTEATRFMWLADFTRGRHSSGHAYQAEPFSFTELLHLLAFNFAEYNQAAGWAHPEWFFRLQDSTLSRPEIAGLLRIAGRGERVWAGEIQPGVRQVEAVLDGQRLLLICNLNPTPVATVAVRPQRGDLVGEKPAAVLFAAKGSIRLDLPVPLGVDHPLLCRDLPPASILQFDLGPAPHSE